MYCYSFTRGKTYLVIQTWRMVKWFRYPCYDVGYYPWFKEGIFRNKEIKGRLSIQNFYFKTIISHTFQWSLILNCSITNCKLCPTTVVHPDFIAHFPKSMTVNAAWLGVLFGDSNTGNHTSTGNWTYRKLKAEDWTVQGGTSYIFIWKTKEIYIWNSKTKY